MFCHALLSFYLCKIFSSSLNCHVHFFDVPRSSSIHFLVSLLLEVPRIPRPLPLKGLDGVQDGLVVADEAVGTAQGLVRLGRDQTALALDEAIVGRGVALARVADDDVSSGEFLAQQIRGGLGGCFAHGQQVPLSVAPVGVFHGPDVHAGHVSDVDVAGPADLGRELLVAAPDPPHREEGLVQPLGGLGPGHRRAGDDRRQDGRDGESGLVFRHPIPDRPFRRGLGRPVGHEGGKVLAGDGLAARVPVGLGVGVVGGLSPPVHHGGDRGGDHERPQGGRRRRRGVGEGRVQDRQVAAHGGPEKVVDVCQGKVDGRGGVDDGVDSTHGRVERTRGGDVGDHGVFVSRVVTLERTRQQMCLGRGRPRRSPDLVPLSEELDADVRGNVPVYTGDENNLVLVGRRHGGRRW